ncbi:MAG TPA: hypothetical protein VIV40_00010 [Kofleriaceae bacterium]
MLMTLVACSTTPANAKKDTSSAPAATEKTETPAPEKTDAPEPPVPSPPAQAEAAGPTTAKKTKMTKYDEAVKLLGSPTSWCTGAKQLVALKDKRALVPLTQAYEKPAEADKLCLSEAMEALGGETEARKLIVSKDASERAVAIRLMILFSSDDQLAPLNEVALHDSDAALRAAAKSALAQQHQTKKWEELIAGYLASPDDAARGWAIDLLIKHNGKSSWQRLQDHSAHEKNADLKAKIDSALARRPK